MTLKTSRFVLLTTHAWHWSAATCTNKVFRESNLRKCRATVFAACDSKCEGHRDGSPAPRHMISSNGRHHGSGESCRVKTALYSIVWITQYYPSHMLWLLARDWRCSLH